MDLDERCREAGMWNRLSEMETNFRNSVPPRLNSTIPMGTQKGRENRMALYFEMSDGYLG